MSCMADDFLAQPSPTRILCFATSTVDWQQLMIRRTIRSLITANSSLRFRMWRVDFLFSGACVLFSVHIVLLIFDYELETSFGIAQEHLKTIQFLLYLLTCFILYFLQSIRVIGSDVKSSRPKWPRGQNFGLGLGLKHLAWARPRSRCHIMLSGIFRAKIVWNSGILLTFPAIILNHRCCYLLIIMWYFFHNYIWPRSWPQPPEIGLGLEVLASFNITG